MEYAIGMAVGLVCGWFSCWAALMVKYSRLVRAAEQLEEVAEYNHKVAHQTEEQRAQQAHDSEQLRQALAACEGVRHAAGVSAEEAAAALRQLQLRMREEGAPVPVDDIASKIAAEERWAKEDAEHVANAMRDVQRDSDRLAAQAIRRDTEREQ